MAITFDATLGTVTNTATLTTSAAAASGSRVFVFIWWYDPVDSLGSVSGGGLTWVIDKQANMTASDGGSHLAVVSAYAPSGLASSTVITPTFDGAIDFGPGIAAHSWTGVKTGASGYVDATTTNRQDTAESWTTPALVTTDANTLLFGFSFSDSASHSEIASYTERHDWLGEGANRGAVVSRVVTSAASYNPGGTWAGTVAFQCNFGIAYKAGGTTFSQTVDGSAATSATMSRLVVPAPVPQLVYHTAGGRWQ